MADDDFTLRNQRIFDQIEREKAAAAGAPPTSGAPAPVPSAIAPDQQDFTQRNQTIFQKGEAGTLPAEGAPPQTGLRAPYGATDAAVHGMTFGGSDLASGYMHDLARGVMGATLPGYNDWLEKQGRPTGFNWGQGAKEAKTARDEYAAANPGTNLAANIAGGIVMPMAGVGKAAELISQIPSAAGKLAGSLGLGGAVGGTTGAIGGAIDEAPLGPEAALEGAKHGGMWGAALGPIFTGAVTALTGGKRALESAVGPVPFRRLFGMDTTAADRGAAGRTLTREATDPAAVQDAGTVQGPPMPPAPPDRPWITGPFSEARQQQQQRQAASETMSDPNAGVLLPGQEPGMPAAASIGQLTDDPGIKLLEDKVYAQVAAKRPSEWTPAEREVFTKSQLQSETGTAALRGEVDPLADPAAVQTPLKARADTLTATHEADTLAAQQRGEAIATRQEADTLAAQQQYQAEQAKLGRDLPAEERGDLIRSEQAAGKKTSKEGGVELNTQLAAANAVTDQSATAAAAKTIKEGMLKNEAAMTGKELEIFDAALMQGTAMPLAETLALRSRITNEVRRVQRAAPGEQNVDPASAARLTKLRQELDATLEPHIAGMDDATGTLYRQRQDYWKQHAETFKNDTTGDILQGGPNQGGYQMLPEAVATRILRDNSSAEAHLAAGGTQDSLRGALVDDLYRFAKGKPLTDNMLATWRTNRQGALRAAPGLDAEIGNVGQAQRVLDDLPRAQKAETLAQTDEMARLAKAQNVEREAFEDGAIGKVLKADPADVGPAVTRILKSDQSASGMMQLKGQVAGDAAAEAALKRIVTSHIADEVINPQNGQINPAQFQRLLEKKGADIETAIGKESMDVLRKIAENQQRTAPGRPIMAGVNKGGTPSSYASLFRAVIEGQRGPSVDSLLALPIAAAAGKGNATLPTLLTFGLQKVIQSARARGIEGPREHLIEAIRNPAYGRALMLEATPDNMPLAEKAVQAALDTGRSTRALTFDYGQAQQRERARERERILAPTP